MACESERGSYARTNNRRRGCLLGHLLDRARRRRVNDWPPRDPGGDRVGGRDHLLSGYVISTSQNQQEIVGAVSMSDEWTTEYKKAVLSANHAAVSQLRDRRRFMVRRRVTGIELRRNYRGDSTYYVVSRVITEAMPVGFFTQLWRRMRGQSNG